MNRPLDIIYFNLPWYRWEENQGPWEACPGPSRQYGRFTQSPAGLRVAPHQFSFYCRDFLSFCCYTYLVGGPALKNPPGNAGDVWLILELGRSLEKEMADHSSILAWEIPRDRGAEWAVVHGVAGVRHNLVTKQQLNKQLTYLFLSGGSPLPFK